jgi:hypothetical protein
VPYSQINFNDVHFIPVYEEAVAGLKRVLQTDQHLFMCMGSDGTQPEAAGASAAC